MSRHGQTGTRAYFAWTNMKTRCFNPKSEKYADYGARGITVCARWMSFDCFFADLGVCPEGLTLERKDVNGNYEPGNCEWLPASDQAKNRRSVLLVDGKRKTYQELGDALGISRYTFQNRLRRGWSLGDAIIRAKGVRV